MKGEYLWRWKKALRISHGCEDYIDLNELMWRLRLGKEVLAKMSSLCKSPETGDLQGLFENPA